MAPDPPVVDWRAAILRVDRVKICQHVMSKLSSLYSGVHVEAVRARTSAFEAKVFHRANSRSDYLKQIAEGLTKAQNPGPHQGGLGPGLLRLPDPGGVTMLPQHVLQQGLHQVLMGKPDQYLPQQQGKPEQYLPQGKQEQQQHVQQHVQQAQQASAQTQQAQVHQAQQAQAHQAAQVQAQAQALARAQMQQQQQQQQQLSSSSGRGRGGGGRGRGRGRGGKAAAAAAAAAAAVIASRGAGGDFGIGGGGSSSRAIETLAKGGGPAEDLIQQMSPEQLQSLSALVSTRQAQVQGSRGGRGGRGRGGAVPAGVNRALQQQMALRQAQLAQVNGQGGTGGAGGQVAGIQPGQQQQLQHQQQMQQMQQMQQHQQQQQQRVALGGAASGSTPSNSSAGARRNAIVAQAARASGITEVQMHSILTSEKQRLEALGATAEQQRAALQAILQRHISLAQGGADGVSGGGNQSSGGGGGAASSSSAARPAGGANATASGAAAPSGPGKEPGLMYPGKMQGVDVIPAAPKPGVVTNPADEAFWVKLEQVQREYRADLIKLYPVIRSFRPESQTPERKEIFLKHVSDCYNICEIERSNQKPPRMTVELLIRAALFMGQIVSAVSRYVQQQQSKNQAAATQQQQTAQVAQQNQAAASQQAANARQQAQLAQQQQQVAASGAQSSPAAMPNPQQMTPQQQAAARVQHSVHQTQHTEMLRKYAAAIAEAKGTGDTARVTTLTNYLQTYNANLRQRQQQQAQLAHKQRQAQAGGGGVGGGAPSSTSGGAPPASGSSVAQPGGAASSSAQYGQQAPGQTAQSQQLNAQRAQLLRNQQLLHAASGVLVPLDLMSNFGPVVQTAHKSGDKARVAQLKLQLEHFLAQRKQEVAQQAVKQQQGQGVQPGQGLQQAQAAQSALALAHQQRQAIAVQQSQAALHQAQSAQQQAIATQASSAAAVASAGAGSNASLSAGRAAPQMANAMPGAGPNQMPGVPGLQQSAAAAGAPPTGPPRQRPPPTLKSKILDMQNCVKGALDDVQRLEARRTQEAKRAKQDRIQITLTTMRNNSNKIAVVWVDEDGKQVEKGTPGARLEKRPFSLVDVDNSPSGPDNVIQSKAVFESSPDLGVRLAKRHKNDTADLRSLHDAVEADCEAARDRHDVLSIDIGEEFGLPLVTCQLMIDSIRLPKMYLRVQRGYPRKGGATYAFERPPLGWVGVLCDIRLRFKNAIALTPSSSVGVATYLDAWAQAAVTACAPEDGESADDEESGGKAKEAEPPASCVDLPADFAAAANSTIIAL